MSRTADYLTELAEDAGIVAELEALTAYAAYVGNAEYAVQTFEDAYAGEWESLEDFAHDQLMEMDEEYRAAVEGCRGWRPRIDMIAWQCDYAHTSGGYVFRSI
ncbi:antirestriction protein ArdA [Streptomyces sp. FH025]|uniref:antirestriction protein ArdA n=1 Tax=Streptomyces sp. FH025 TaxID=2815937 RepID=UPI001A9F7190|nr:antirestriction protein ArdA [Streptomyces sp. FH025]MBO1420294.1 antirestriction protein ArdA [Streptomyces sp. FH025]